MQLSPWISFRAFADTAVVVDHRRHELHQLNAAAGKMLERLEQGAREFTPDDQEFLAQLVDLGIVSSGSASPPGPALAPRATQDAGQGQVLERINRLAAAELVPLHCQLELTYRCTLACRHCYLGKERSLDQNELTLEEITDLLDELADLGCLFLLLTGGEPFCRSDLLEIVTHARARRFAVSLLTSGQAVEPAIATGLAELGLDNVQVSLHGARATTHDTFTGLSGSFEAALEALRLFRDRGVKVRASVTVTRQNEHSLAQIHDLARAENVPVALGLYLEPCRDGSLAPQKLQVDQATLTRALQLFPPDSPPRLRGRAQTDPPCHAAANTVALDPQGTVFPCLPLRLPAGSIRKSPLSKIWQTSPTFERLRSLQLADLHTCPTCELKESCNRCPAFALAEGKSELDHATFDCLLARVLTSIQEVKEK